MKNALAFIAAFLALATAGCVTQGKAKTPATPAPVAAKPATPPVPPAPPPRLSSPQTQVELPPEQKVDPAAYSADTPPVTTETIEPAPSPRPTTTRRPSVPANPPAATQTPATLPTAVPPAAEPAPPQIGEIVPAAEAQKLQQQAVSRRREVQQILDGLSRRSLSTAQTNMVTRINSFIASSVDAEKRNDMKLADALAERAQILAKDLASGK